MSYVEHLFEPCYDENSKVLLLGTIPSSKSREEGFYYMHPKNRFWQVLSNILKEPFPKTIEEKKELLKKHHIALYDCLFSCWIDHSSDASIKDINVNDLSIILEKSMIKRIYTTGKKAYDIYQKYIYPKTGIEATYLPSTSPANASFSLEQLQECYSSILIHL